MFVRAFADRHRTARYKEFLARYKEFRREDVVTLCDECHFEIHLIYGDTIRQSLARTGQALHRYTWNQAEILMERLGILCEKWLSNPADYTVQSAREAKTLLQLGCDLSRLPKTEDQLASLRRLSRAS